MGKYISIMTEEWRDVNGYNGIYQVSNFGNVRHFRQKDGFVGFKISDSPKLMSLSSNGNGYLYVSLRLGNKRKNHYVHRLVAETFIGEIPDGYVINHIDYDKANNKVTNLEIVTQLENVLHSVPNMKKPRPKGENFYICHRPYGTYEVAVNKKHVGYYKTLQLAFLVIT